VIPVTLYQHGFRELVSVVPPNAQLSPRSKLAASSLGKAPGIKYQTGAWGGYDWLKHEPTESDIKQWAQDGANFGILAAKYPAVDIDVLDPDLAEVLQTTALACLGPAPVRVGRAPKRLLMYALADDAEAFGRIGAKLTDGSAEYLIEVLGAGRQYVISGTHPLGARYEWTCDLEELRPEQLTRITRGDVLAFFATLESDLPILGWEVQLLGEQGGKARAQVEQDTLKAPSLEALLEAVAAIPNTSDVFPDRESYIRLGYAIRAASQDFEMEGMDCFIEWAGRHEGTDGRVERNPETPRSDWRKMAPPYSIGWDWLAQFAKRFGFNPGVHEFEALPDDAHPSEEARAPELSEQDLADEVYAEHGDCIRYMPGSRRWYVWDGARWAVDAIAQAESRIARTLRRIAVSKLRTGGSVGEKAKAAQQAETLTAAWKMKAVRDLVQRDQRITTTTESFDTNPWLLNTPTGIVDLRTGELRPHDPNELMTKLTAAGPDSEAKCPAFTRFLEEATGGDVELQKYLQRMAGYCLTGSTQAEVLFFLWGPGGNGKTKFVGMLTGLLGDYAGNAPMDMFNASHSDRHPTDLAALQGARLVSATETQAGKRWDEARIKALTGGDRVAARFMRGDFFRYTPQFKLLFMGNHKPEIRDIDAAMRRRLHLIPFTVTPRVVDQQLSEKLEAEYPAVLAWCIEGCLEWQRSGLRMPQSVQDMTQEYFRAEDAVGRWIAERCKSNENEQATTVELFDSWREWANRNGEYVGSMKRLAQALINRKLERWQEPSTRRMGFRGLRPFRDFEKEEG
jgi:P4 family phage/plasmid primase-like protien